jgi:hypothetical protein
VAGDEFLGLIRYRLYDAWVCVAYDASAIGAGAVNVFATTIIV